MASYRDVLFKTYGSTHAMHLDPSDEIKIDWFLQYVRENYSPHLTGFDKATTHILDVGCNKGYALVALSTLGFQNLSGIDLSPEDVQKAQTIIPTANITYGDAFEYLSNKPSAFDVIICKATLEHILKNQILPLLGAFAGALKPGGMLIIDVPNMDWLVAQHERYMDFTHEVGFTRESLAQVLRNLFTDVTVVKGHFIKNTPTLKAKLAFWLRPVIIVLINQVLKIIGEGASDIWWDSRNIVAIAKK